ncbi:DNA damage-binding protein 1 [Geosmithia morbida]|uniref:DNA damage-binding protein 1 n=1 Tax=Geosmithia morbida TaxID=1094350 RepID=A0A9P4Z2H7_9HYPO|nr:DNA damage-binding protein 1 [Geosmithia morbida]KAF4126505.1 DNA damage-binding protein 1 [Geosmithia morbida]
MAYVAPVHRATSVRHALRMRFTSPDEYDLVIAKSNRLEIWRPSEEGLTCLHTRIVYGTIAMMQRLQPKDSDTDLLFIGTDRQQYFTVAWNPDKNKLETVKESSAYDESEPYMRHSQSQNQCLVDPTGKFMAMHLWEGVLNVFRLPTRAGNRTRLLHLAQVRLSELWMKASTFLYSRDGHPRIAFLYKTRIDQEDARVAVYRLTKDDQGGDVSRFDPVRDREHDETISDPYASMLIPIRVPEEKRYHKRYSEGTRAHLGGLLIVGETLLTYIDSLTYSTVSSALKEPKIYVAWAEYDDTRYIVADDYGSLDLLTIEAETEPSGIIVTGMKIEPLVFEDGTTTTSRASKLVYMGDGILYLASHHGDCQVIRIDVDLMRMSILNSQQNNAPILDFAIMDIGNREGDSQAGNAFSSGQARIVAGCGAYRDGSLRSIRSGVGLDDTGILDDIEGSRGLFTLKSHGSELVDTLAVSLVNETRVFRFDPTGEIEEVYQFAGMLLDSETLLASSLPNGHLLQVTPQSVRLLDPEGGITVSTWEAPDGKTITAASANDTWALLSIDGSILVSLNLTDNLAMQTQTTDTETVGGIPDQMSCLHASPAQELGFVGWWSSGTISVVDPKTLKAIQGITLRQSDDSASVPRDIVLVQLHPPERAGPTLLISTEDGNVVTFDVSREGFTLSGRKTVTLGSSPARLHVLPQEDGTNNIFATTEHSSLIYGFEGRIIYSATTADDATYVAPFNSEAFPDAIILSTNNHVRLSKVDKERLTHVKSLPMGETVRRVAYSASLRAFGLGTIKKELVDSEEVVTSSFRLVDEIVFKELGKPLALDGSTGLELVECISRAELVDSSGKTAERFIVGTSYMPDDEATAAGDKTRGRIIVLGVDENRQAYRIVSHNLKGNCRCLSVVDGFIIAGLSKTVAAYRYTETTSASGSLEKLAAYRPASMPIDLDVSGNVIGVSDLMQSLTLVEFTAPAEGKPAKLEELARHYEPAWSTALCHLGDGRWLEADAQGNLTVLRRNSEAPTDQDRRRLELISDMNIGEQINRIRRLYLAPSDDAVVTPKAFLGSVEGSLYLYGEVSPKYQDLLISFQSNMTRCIETTGDLSFDQWRSFRNHLREGEGPFRFLDGEMLERFLDMTESTQELVCEGLGPSVEEMRNIIEELRRLH